MEGAGKAVFFSISSQGVWGEGGLEKRVYFPRRGVSEDIIWDGLLGQVHVDQKLWD